MINGICGSIGSGKTLYVMSLLEMAVLSGRPVYTNIDILPACPVYGRVARIDDVAGEWPVSRETPGPRGFRYFWEYLPEGAIIFIDEPDVLFWCRKRSQAEHDLFVYHKQSRKYQQDLYYVLQRPSNLDLSIRSMVQKWVYCEWNYRSSSLISRLPISWSRFLRAEYSSPDWREAELIGTGYFTYAEGSRFFGWYRTRQTYGGLDFGMGREFLDDQWRQRYANSAAINAGNQG